MPKLLQKRGTRAQLESAKAANQLSAGEIYVITDENRIAVGLSENTYQDYAKEPIITTWANRPANGAGLTPYIDRIFFTDIGVGGSEWYWDGSRYRVAGGQVVLSGFTASDYSAKPTYTGTTTATTVIRVSNKIPAGLLHTGDQLIVDFGYDTPTASTTTTRIIKLGLSSTQQNVGSTNNSSTLNASSYLAQLTANNKSYNQSGVKYNIERSPSIKAVCTQFNGALGVSSSTFDAAATVSNLSTTDTWFYVGMQCGAADTAITVTLQHFTITLRTCG